MPGIDIQLAVEKATPKKPMPALRDNPNTVTSLLLGLWEEGK